MTRNSKRAHPFHTTYDKSGNLTDDAEGREFLYDAENHQKEVKNAQDQTVGAYLYDGDGKRIKKVSNTETTIFVYNGGGKLIAEYSTQLAQTQQVSYLTQDHLGSPRIITNENGVVTGRKDYTAFGEETYSANRISALGYINQDELRKGYTGYEKDDESGLDFAQARYYNSSHGRFTSVDPLNGSIATTDPQTFNRYTYGLNSPYKFTDPLGLLPQSAFSNNSCSAENSYNQCGGDSGFWGGSFSDREAEYNRIYGGLSNEVARGLGRYLSIQENGYDPEFERFTGDVRLQILDSDGKEIYGEDFSKPTLDQIEAKAEEFNQGIYRNQVRERLKARGLEGRIILTNSGYGFTFTINDGSKDFVENLLDDSSKFNSSTSSFYFGFHKKDANCNVGGGCVDYRSIDGKGSDQFVFNRSLRAGYVDTDRFNPRRSIGGFLGHAFLEVLPNTLSGSNNVQGVSFRGFPPYQPRFR